MVFGVAVVATSVIISAIVAIIVGGTYEAIAHGRWPVDIPASAVAAVALSVTAGGVIGASLG